MSNDHRRFSPATVRNREPILAVLRPRLPDRGLVLEIASGSGEHVTHFAEACSPDLVWQPSDPDPAARASCDAWAAARQAGNVRPALALDAGAAVWPIAGADAVLCINMIHISPWTATEGLMAGARRVLPSNGLLFLYGPFRRNGRHTSVSNERFDAELRALDAAWGVRDLEVVTAHAEACGFATTHVEAMPANNLSVVLHRRGG